MQRICDTCGCEIPQMRVEAIPNVTTCVGCSRESKYVGFNDWYHKTAPEIVMVRSNDTENLRRAMRMNNRSR